MKFLSVMLTVMLCSTAAYADGFIQRGNARIHYLERNPGGARTLVLIPGWSADANIWNSQIAYFSKSMHVVAIDPRSQGESSKTDEGNTPSQRAADYEAVFAALKLQHAVLVGWSQGVQDVTSYVQQFGGARLDGVVLVDAAISKGAAQVSANPKFVQGLLGNIDLYQHHKREYLAGMMHFIYSRKMSDAEFNALVDTGMKTPTAAGVAELTGDMLGTDLRPALKQFDKPTLIIASAKSFELADQKAEVAQLPHGSFAQIDNAAHGVFVDQPDAFNRILDGFIKQLP